MIKYTQKFEEIFGISQRVKKKFKLQICTTRPHLFIIIIHERIINSRGRGKGRFFSFRGVVVVFMKKREYRCKVVSSKSVGSCVTSSQAPRGSAHCNKVFLKVGESKSEEHRLLEPQTASCAR